MHSDLDRAPRGLGPTWPASARELLAPPRLSAAEQSAYEAWSKRRIIERFRGGLPLGVAVALALAYFYSEEATADRRQTLMVAVGVAATTLALSVPIGRLGVFRAHPNALILPVSLILSGAIAAVASTGGAFEPIAAALALLIWIYGSVLAPLPPRWFVIDVVAQYAVITPGVWVGATTIPWMYLALTLSGMSLSVLGVFMRENGDRRSFVAHRRLDDAHSLLAEKQAELAALNRELGERVERQVGEIVAHARDVEALNAQLQQRVIERSRELAATLERLRAVEGPASTHAISTGTVIGERARVLRPLGQGGMGEVYLAEDLVTQRTVALKVLRSRPGLDETALRRMVNEAAASATVSHSGAVRTLHVDVSSDGRLYLLTDFVEGETLRNRLSRGPLGAAGAARLGQALASVLAAAHAQNVVHRDVKPQNVMLTHEEPGVKLLDFGISKSSDELFETALTASGQVVGTPAYMAPEQLTGKDLSGATDVYSLGLLVYEAASGRGPFEFGSAQEAFAAHAIDEPEKLSKRVPDVPAEMSDLVARCLAKNPADRPAASEVARMLGHIAETLGAPRATELGGVAATVQAAFQHATTFQPSEIGTK